MEITEPLEERQVALARAPRHGPMLAPLDINDYLTLSSPIGVQNAAMPVGPDISWRAGRIVSHPHDFLVSGDRERKPGSVRVVTPEQMVRDNRSRWVHDGQYSYEREPFVAL